MGLALSNNIYYVFLSVKVEKRGLLHFAAILHACDSGSLYGTVHIVVLVCLRVLRLCATKGDMDMGSVLQGTKPSYLALMQTLSLTLHSLKCREELERRP